MRYFLLLLTYCVPLLGSQLVDIHTVCPRIHVDNLCLLPYGFPPEAHAHTQPIYIEEFVAIRLKRVHEDLNLIGLGLIIHAGYRPPSVQQLVAASYGEDCEKAIAQDAAHYCKGLGVDVSLHYCTGQRLCLPSYYGEASPRSGRDYPNLRPVVSHNMQILQEYMRKHGFVSQEENWWHYDLKGWNESPNLDIEI